MTDHAMTDVEGLSRDALKARLADAEASNRRWSKVADERSKENCALRQLLRDARDHVPWDVLKRIDEALGAARVEQQTGESK